MAGNESENEFVRADEFPPLEPLFHENHVLELQNYLDFFEALSNKYRFGIVYLLYTDRELSAKELEQALDRTSNGLHYHLRKLVKLGLVQNHKRERSDDGGLYSYYRLTPVGETITQHVVSMFDDQRGKLTTFISDETEPADTGGIGTQLAELLTTENTDVRRWAVASFSDLASIDPNAAAQAVDTLVELLDDERAVQVDAIQSLLRIAETAPEIIPDQTTDTLYEVYQEIFPEDSEDYPRVKEFLRYGRRLHHLRDEPEAEARACYVIADRAEQFEAVDEVVEYYQTALERFEEVENIGWQLTVHERLARLFSQEGEFDTALLQLEEALDKSSGEGFESNRIRLRRQIGAIHRHRQEPQAALDALEAAQAEFAELELDDTELKTAILGTKADVLRDQGDFGEAKELYNEALELIGDESPYLRSQLLLSKALIPGRQGKHQTALSLLEEARETIFDHYTDGELESGDRDPRVATILSEVESNIGVAHTNLENFDDAVGSYDWSIIFHLLQGDLRAVFEKLNTVITIAKNTGDTSMAIDRCDQALALIQFAQENLDRQFSEVVHLEYFDEMNEDNIDRIGMQLQAEADESMKPFLNEMKIHLRVRKAKLSGSRDPLEDAYSEALKLIDNGDFIQAHNMLDVIWDKRESFERDADPYEIIISAGVALAGCLEELEHDNPSAIKEELRTALAQSEIQPRPVPLIFFNLLTTDSDDWMVGQTDEPFQEVVTSEVTSELAELELDAFRTMFLSLVADSSDDDTPLEYEPVASPQDLDGQNDPLAI
ncbi:tetratricopeptide repeat protein [Natrialba sp. INN-245]|uniref:tetratricopeptide repeat protein n=1 Tax=Natrialba sp. INN-245 TaxID=2690967 RepID=UPI0013101F28|nr:tetratricopeptide repeat protein [Natrialba sp. INN-245]MWV41046.1 tetratricopeptide repeat protein [Natrialba sp. INN-245]